MKSFNKTVIFTLLLVLPCVILFEIDAKGFFVPRSIFVAVVLLSIGGLIIAILRSREKRVEPVKPIRNEEAKKFAVKPTFFHLFLPKGTYLSEHGQHLVYVGKLLDRADKVFQKIYNEFDRTGLVPMLTENNDKKTKQADGPVCLILISKREIKPEKYGPALSLLLLFLSFLSLVWIIYSNRAAAAGGDISFLYVSMRMAALVIIILITYAGTQHVITRSYNQLATSYPMFLPIPSAFGAFGFLNTIQSFVKDRYMLFQITFSGPLIALLIGLLLFLSDINHSVIVLPGETSPDSFTVNIGSSLFLSMIGKIVLGIDIGKGHLLRLTEDSFVGWLTILITCVNLLPLGELQGGRIARAMFFRSSSNVLDGIMWFLLIMLGILFWSGWLVVVTVVFIFSYRHKTVVLNQISPIRRWQQAIGVAMLLFVFIVLIPLPHTFYRILGLHCPYL
ncbi:hypothetical protein JNM05_15810 [bacterium]|nr:hypothetical protein [bacterium]